jgi:putative oxidoreductase
MKIATHIAAGLLGVLCIVFGLNFWLKFIDMGEGPAEPHAKAFLSVLMPTGYMAFVKALEVIGGLLLVAPKTRNLGLLVLGPIIVNIFCFGQFVRGGKDVTHPVFLAICAMAGFLLWVERKAWAGLVKR